MFALLLRPNRGLRRLPRFLAVEILENRDCPASLTLETIVLPSHEIQLSGAVIGDFTPGSVVTFDGAVTGECVVDSTGQYLFTTTEGSLGEVSAVGMFDDATFTDPIANIIATPAPTVSLAIADMNDETVTFTGTVTGVDAAFQTLPIPGSTEYMTTDAQGNFTFTMPRNECGIVGVCTTDLWGQTSNLALLDLTPVLAIGTAPLQNPPIITMTCVQGENANLWTFQGTVNGDNVQGLTVTITDTDGRPIALATVGADGTYSITVEFGAPPTGMASAQTTTLDGLSSNEATWNF